MDTSFQSDKDNCKSQSGFVSFIMSEWALVWKSSKQDIIEAEYMRVSNMVLETVLDQRSSLDEFGVVPSIVDLIPMYWDNNGAIAQAMEPRSHQRDPNMFSGVYHLILEIIARQDVKI